MHILVMTESWQGALACIQSFGRKGHEVSVVAGDRISPNARSRYVKNIVKLSGDTLDSAADNLIQIAEKLKIDLVIPVSDGDSLIVSKAQKISKNKKLFPCGNMESVMTIRSRNKTTSLCRKIGVPTPSTIFISHDTAVVDALEFGFPFFLKLSGTVASQGVYKIDNEKILVEVLSRIPRKSEMQFQAPICGDFLDITGFCLEGKVMKSFSFRGDYDMSLGGNLPHVRRLENRKLEEILSKLAKALNWTGGIDLDLLEDSAGNVYLLEINPRFSGTIIFPLKLGIDLPACYLGHTEEAVERPLENDKPFGFISLRTEIEYLKKDLEKWKARSIDFRNTYTCLDDSFWDDPAYSAAFFENTIRILLSDR